MIQTIRLMLLENGQGLPLPSYATPGSAGVDLRAAVPDDNPITLNPGGRSLIPTGMALAIPTGFEGQVRPRSGLSLKFGITCLNSPGTIDSDYRGEIGVILANMGSEPFTVRRGDRIAQLVIAPYARAEFETVKNLETTQRGESGFGSTGT